MKTINTKIMIYVLVGLVVATVLITYILNNSTIDLNFWIKCSTKSVMVVCVFSYLFSTILWKMHIFQRWFVLVPNLNGIWEGELQSDWIDPNTNEKIPPIEATLIIKQSLFHVSCIMKTDEMTSRSIAYGFNIDPDNQLIQLSYIYISTPLQTIQERSRIHYGSVIFDIEEKELNGNYWTARKTTGIIKMKWKYKLN